MKLLSQITLVAASFLFAGAALAQTDQQRRLALAAHDAAVANKPAPQAPADPRAREKALQARFEALCKFAPVMSDAAIEGCRQAHKL